MRLFPKTHIDFIGNRFRWYAVSSIVIALGLISVFVKGIDWGIDFTGGTELAFRFEQAVPISDIRMAMDEAGFRETEIKTFGAENQILIRTKEIAGDVLEKVNAALIKTLPTNKFELLKQDKIGPKIGRELRLDAVYAVLVSFLALLVYLSVRFEFVYALGAVLGLFHDVLIVFGLVSIFNRLTPWFTLEFSQNLIAAFLTLIGFSTNDTVVIFDRIRENRKLYKAENLISLMNRSINETLSRTVITSSTVFVTVLVLMLFGGEVLRGFSFAFLIGTVTGTYSSIFVSSAFVVDWTIHVRKQPLEHPRVAGIGNEIKAKDLKLKEVKSHEIQNKRT
jgi:preprotein translocase SecF subunit